MKSMTCPDTTRRLLAAESGTSMCLHWTSQSKFAGEPGNQAHNQAVPIAGPGYPLLGLVYLQGTAISAGEDEDIRAMNRKILLRDWARLIYYLSQNTLSLIGVVLTTSSAMTLIGFWIYDFMLPGSSAPVRRDPHFPALPGVFVLGLVLMPIGIFLRRRNCRLPARCPRFIQRSI